jgi:pimeloyl-ACP methyl ester carboxylesterase
MTEFLDVQGGRIAYDVTGEGPLVVLAHGLGDVRGLYRFAAPRLVEAGYRVATADLRGCGESDAGFADYSQEAVGADLLALIRHLAGPAGGPALLWGHSYSAASAVWVATEAPSEVTGIVLSGPFVRDVPLNPAISLASKLIGYSARLWTMYYRSNFKTAKPADLDAYVAALRTSMRRPGHLAALRAMFAAPNGPTEARLPRVTVPTLVLIGSRDGDFKDPAAEAALIAGKIGPSAKTAIVDGGGHYAPAELPGPTVEAVLNFHKEA